MKTVCEKLATQIDKLAQYFENSKYLIEFKKLSKIGQLQYLEKLNVAGESEKLKLLGGIEKLVQLEHLKNLGQLEVALSSTQLLTSGLINIGKETLHGVVGSVISEKIVTKGLEEILQGLKPKIQKQVNEAVKEQIQKEQLRLVKKKISIN